MNILIAEDEPSIAGILDANLKHAGYDTLCIENGLDVLAALTRFRADLILLDVMLPGINGYELCRDIRSVSDIPIIMVTAKVNEDDRLKGFELGVDDYVCKPFSPREVVARVRSLLRRNHANTLKAERDIAQKVAPSISLGKLYIEQSTLCAHVNQKKVLLTVTEFNLLYLLMKQPQRIFERSRLLDQLASSGEDCTERAIDSHIKNLRQKLRQLFPGQDIIKSVYGVGYRFNYTDA